MQAGFRNPVSVDAFHATQRAGAARSTLLNTLALEQTQVADYWSTEAWSPIQTGGAFERNPEPLRQCIKCAAHGYHSALFQLPSITRCPWHHTRLRRTCSGCGAKYSPRFDATGLLGQCRCGADPFQEDVASIGMWSFPTEAADAWASAYQTWVSEQRKCRILIAGDGRAGWKRGLAALARPPKHFGVGRRSARGRITSLKGGGEDPAHGAFWGWCLFGGERPLTHVSLPKTVAAQLESASAAVLTRMRVEHGMTLNLATVSDPKVGETASSAFNDKDALFISPFWKEEGRATWLNISILDRDTISYLGQVLDRVASMLGSTGEIKRSLQATQSEALDGIKGRRHLSYALETLLRRSYVQCLEFVVRKQAGQPDFSQRGGWLIPIVEVRGRDRSLDMVRVCWVDGRPAGVSWRIGRHPRKRRVASEQRSVSLCC